MRPCWKNRKRIAWLALGELDPGEAQKLRVHFSACPGCRQRFEKLSSIKHRLKAVGTEPEMESSAAFHRRLMTALRTETPGTPLLGWVRLLYDWRTALAFGLVILSAVLLWSRSARFQNPVVAGPGAMASSVESASQHSIPAPTLANYQRAAESSLDALDELLSEQARSCSPAPPVYTASTYAYVGLSRASDSRERSF